jgi:phage-related protein
MGDVREVEWQGDSRERLRGFPDEVKWLFGRALYKAQLGKRHPIAALMRGRLRGVVELRAREGGDAYRLYYTLKCPGCVYVLYCHKKKSKRGIGTPSREKKLVRDRYRDAMDHCQRKREER